MKKTLNFMLLTLGVVGIYFPLQAIAAPSLPDFMSKEQLVKWESSKVAQTQVASKEQPLTQFYTGKPYVSEAGGYIFKYRTYNPEMSRWTSSDPSGFPDGPNSQIYAPIPTMQLDSAGLDTKTIAGVTVTASGTTATASSGPLTMTITEGPTVIDDAIQGESIAAYTATGTGWIVQYVTRSSSVFNNSDNSRVDNADPDFSYYEAIHVSGGVLQNTDPDAFTTVPYDPDTHGSANITGTIGFFTSVGSGSDDPANWTVGNSFGGVSQAGSYKATTSKPSFWTETGVVTHTLDLVWD